MNTKAKTPAEMVTEQRRKYRETLCGKWTIPANSETLVEIKISTLGAFLAEKITGSYTTLKDETGTITDTGVNYMSAQILDGANSLPLTNDYIDLDLIFSPGRVKSSAAANNNTTAAPNGFLFFPLDFRYIFASMSSVQLRFRNTSNVANTVSIALHGYRLRG